MSTPCFQLTAWAAALRGRLSEQKVNAFFIQGDAVRDLSPLIYPFTAHRCCVHALPPHGQLRVIF